MNDDESIDELDERLVRLLDEIHRDLCDHGWQPKHASGAISSRVDEILGGLNVRYAR